MTYRLVLALLLQLALASPARAAMMVNYDLAGLVLQSKAIVVADPRPASPRGTAWSDSIRGSLGAGTELALDDGLYDTAGTDARVIVFVTPHPDGGWFITSSGLRVVKAGKVFRFEQWNNPGGFTAVPQGHDPQDNWIATTDAIDLPTLERELADAIRRVDALDGALRDLDRAKRRAAVLALLPPAGSSRPPSGFYVDALSQEAERALGKLGDVEGALRARTHDHSAIDRFLDVAGLAELVAFAQATANDEVLRIIAIRLVAGHSNYFANVAAARAMLGLFADPSPAVRAAAVTTAARTWQWSSSDHAEQVTVVKLARETRAAVAKLFATESANATLYAILAAYEDGALPSRRGPPPVVAHAQVRGGTVYIEVVCLRRGTRLDTGKVLAGGTEVAANLTLRCGETSLGGGSPGAKLPPGSSALSVELVVDRKPVTIALGSLVAESSGELTLR